MTLKKGVVVGEICGCLLTEYSTILPNLKIRCGQFENVEGRIQRLWNFKFLGRALLHIREPIFFFFFLSIVQNLLPPSNHYLCLSASAQLAYLAARVVIAPIDRRKSRLNAEYVRTTNQDRILLLCRGRVLFQYGWLWHSYSFTAGIKELPDVKTSRHP